MSKPIQYVNSKGDVVLSFSSEEEAELYRINQEARYRALNDALRVSLRAMTPLEKRELHHILTGGGER